MLLIDKDDNIFRERKSKYPELERKLLNWYNSAISKIYITHIPITESILLYKLNQLSEKKFHISYVQNLMKRNKLSSVNLHGEASSCPNVNISNVRKIISSYKPMFVFNMDESGLYYSQLPRKCVIDNHEKKNFKGFKIAKSRISIAITVNMDNSIKVPILYIGKSQKPLCFNEKPNNYINQSNAWMDNRVFKYYMDNIFLPSVKDIIKNNKVLLVMDNCASHPRSLIGAEYDNIQLLFLPPNCTSRYQPLDMGIINKIKSNYKTEILKKCVENIENFELIKNIQIENSKGKGGIALCKQPNIADAMYYSTKVFFGLKKTTVIKCWLKSSLPSEEQIKELNSILQSENCNMNVDDDEESQCELSQIIGKVNDIIIEDGNTNSFINATSLFSTKSISELYPFYSFENEDGFKVEVVDNVIQENSKEDSNNSTCKTKRRIDNMSNEINKTKKSKINNIFE